VRAPGFCTPRSDMHMCAASSTTPTPFGAGAPLEPARDLARQALLDLEVAREEVNRPRELRQSHDALTRQVAHVRHVGGGEQVVLAHRVERNRTGDDELVIALVVGKRRGIEGNGREEVRVERCHPSGRRAAALAREVDAEGLEERGCGMLRAPEVNSALLGEDAEMRTPRRPSILFRAGRGHGHAAFASGRRRFLPRPRAKGIKILGEGHSSPSGEDRRRGR